MEEKVSRISFEDLLDAGVHFGHLKRKWNPNMAPYIFMERKGIHIIDLYKTQAKINEAASALKQIAKSGKQILFVATKKQAQDIIATKVQRVNMPYVTERWPGGMLTNFGTIRRTIRKMKGMEKLMNDNAFQKLSKRERLQIGREKAKMEKQFGSIADMNRLPHAVFVVDIIKEYIAVREAQKLDITTFAMVDTNSNPEEVDFPIPANDDASKSIDLVMEIMIKAVEEGLAERKMEREKAKEEKEKKEKQKKEQKAAAKKAEEAKEQEEAEAAKPDEEQKEADKQN
ncbi:MAG: 30S ribosomal protein S2 [Bacteroidales bacterium]|nr:30S ribosomal protein S2 [Bacteroidales bacterium]